MFINKRPGMNNQH